MCICMSVAGCLYVCACVCVCVCLCGMEGGGNVGMSMLCVCLESQVGMRILTLFVLNCFFLLSLKLGGY